MKSVIPPALVFVTALSAAPAFGTIVVSSTAPSGPEVVIAQPNGNDFTDPFYTSDTSRRAIGENFKLIGSETPFTLDKITMQLHTADNAGASGSPWVASLYVMVNDSSGARSSTIYSEQPVGNMPALTPNSTVFVTFDVPDAAIAAGTSYGFIMDFANAAATHQFPGSGTGWGFSTSSERPDSVGLSQTDGNPFGTIGGGSSSDDIVFFIHAVPEPSAVLLACLGSVGLFGYRLHRRMS